jgi:hypothetical protein
MEDEYSSARRTLLLTGAVVGFIGLLIPGLYGASYTPPAGSPYASINLHNLAGFSGFGGSAVYNGFDGPVSFHTTFIGLVVAGIVALVARVVNFENALWIFTVKGVSLLGLTWSAVTFIWAFRDNLTPAAMRAKFVSDLGGGKSAVAASQYLHASLGAGSLILFFGLLTAYAGVSPKIGCSLLALCIIAFVILYFVSN